jgi:superfamily II DNA/RNA helicase
MSATLYQKGSLLQHGKKTSKNLQDYVPVDYILGEIDRMYGSGDNIFLLESKTGSGKSTGFSVSCYKKYMNEERKIINIQPRVITTETIVTELASAEYVKTILGKTIDLGVNIGMSMGKEKIRCKEKACIVYYVYRSFFNKLLSSNCKNFLETISVLILDEIHEDDLTIYLLLKKLRDLWVAYKTKTPYLPSTGEEVSITYLPRIVITSATFEKSKFLNYFNLPDDHYFQVGGTQFDKTLHYIPQDTTDVYKEILHFLKDIILPEQERKNSLLDILIFMVSAMEGDALKALFTKEIDLKKFNVEILLLSRNEIQKNSQDYKRVVDDTYKKRKIIIGTNVAETGVTFNRLGYVINHGWEQNMYYVPYYNCSLIIREPHSKNSDTQRIGRVGRKFRGSVFRIMTEKTQQHLRQERSLVLHKQNLSHLLLFLFGEQIDVIEKIPIELMYDALFMLYHNGLVKCVSKSSSQSPGQSPSNLYRYIKYDAKKNVYDFSNTPQLSITPMGTLAKSILTSAIGLDEISLSDIRFLLGGICVGFRVKQLCTIVSFINALSSMDYSKIFTAKKQVYNIPDGNDFYATLEVFNKELQAIEKKCKTLTFSTYKSKLFTIFKEFKYVFNILEYRNILLENLYGNGIDIYADNDLDILSLNDMQRAYFDELIKNSYITNYVSKDGLYRSGVNRISSFYMNKSDYVCAKFQYRRDKGSIAPLYILAFDKSALSSSNTYNDKYNNNNNNDRKYSNKNNKNRNTRFSKTPNRSMSFKK